MTCSNQVQTHEYTIMLIGLVGFRGLALSAKKSRINHFYTKNGVPEIHGHLKLKVNIHGLWQILENELYNTFKRLHYLDAINRT